MNSKRVTVIADRLMDESQVQNTQAGDRQATDVQRMVYLASSKALLSMAQILRVTATELKVEEAGLAKREESAP